MKLSDLPFLEKETITQHSSRISLHDETVLWFLEKGSLDLFAVEILKGKAEGRHLFIKEFEGPALLFGFAPPEKEEMIAIIEPGSVVAKLERNRLLEALQLHPTLQQAFIPFLNRWVGSLPTFITFPPPEPNFRYVQASQKPSLLLKKGEQVLPEHLIGGPEEDLITWAAIEKGSFSLLGWKEASLTSPFWLPLRAELWWKAEEDSSLQPISPLKLVQENAWMEALAHFHQTFLKAIGISSQERAQKEKELIERKSRLEEQSLNESFAALASVLEKEEKIYIAKEDPLLLAMQIVGKNQAILFQAPKESVSPLTVSGRIRAICDVSDARFRQISLVGAWYKEDNGHLVGFLGPHHEPVALLSSDSGTYTLVHPFTQEKQKVDGELASQLSPVAFEFFAPFPEKKIETRLEALKFACQGSGSKVALVFILGALITLLNLSIPFGAKALYGVAIPQLDKTLLWQIGSALYIAAISSLIYQFCQGFLIFRIISIAGNRFETAIWDRLLKLPTSFFKHFTVGDLYSRINGFVTIRRSFNNYYILLILNALFSVFYLVAMCIFSFTLSVIAVFVVALSLGFFYLCLRASVLLQRSSYEIKGELNGFIIQVISGIAKLRVTGGEKKAFAHWAKRYAEAKKNDLTSQYYTVASDTTFAAMPTLAALLIFAVIIYFVSQTQTNPEVFRKFISAGNFFGFIAAFGSFSGAIFGSVPAFSFLYKVLKPIWTRGDAFFETDPEVGPLKKQTKLLEGQIAFEQVFFRYDLKTPYILKNISLKAMPGEFIGIVGPSGSGKSTLFRLLLGFETPDQGSVSYDNVDLAHLDVRAIRRQLGVVLQNGSILAGTIYENLVCGGIYSPQQVERAIHLSAFDQDLWNFPMGLHTILPNNGETLSGGQKQRLLIARALISDPKILLFDEATSSLDNRTQEKLSQNIEKLHVTRIVIAHRLSTLRHSDRIYVIQQGEVIDQGTFDELAARTGLFSQLVSRQKI